MNRRGFLSEMLRAGVAAMALPSAMTYTRVWVPPKQVVRFFIPTPVRVDFEIMWQINQIMNTMERALAIGVDPAQSKYESPCSSVPRIGGSQSGR